MQALLALGTQEKIELNMAEYPSVTRPCLPEMLPLSLLLFTSDSHYAAYGILLFLVKQPHCNPRLKQQ